MFWNIVVILKTRNLQGDLSAFQDTRHLLVRTWIPLREKSSMTKDRVRRGSDDEKWGVCLCCRPVVGIKPCINRAKQGCSTWQGELPSSGAHKHRLTWGITNIGMGFRDSSNCLCLWVRDRGTDTEKVRRKMSVWPNSSAGLTTLRLCECVCVFLYLLFQDGRKTHG